MAAAAHLEGVGFGALGPVTLKNILAPVEIFEVMSATGTRQLTNLTRSARCGSILCCGGTTDPRWSDLSLLLTRMRPGVCHPGQGI